MTDEPNDTVIRLVPGDKEDPDATTREAMLAMIDEARARVVAGELKFMVIVAGETQIWDVVRDGTMYVRACGMRWIEFVGVMAHASQRAWHDDTGDEKDGA